MPINSIQDLAQDPNFMKLAFPDQLKVMGHVDPNFGAMAPPDQIQVAMRMRANHIRQQSATYDSNPTVNGSETMQYMKNAAQVLPGTNMVPGLGTPDLNMLQTAGKTLYNDVSGMAQAVSPQATSHPVLQGIAGAVAPGLAQVPQVVMGDIQGRTDRAQLADQLQQQGQTTNSGIQRLASLVPVLGNMLPTTKEALQPGAAGIAVARGSELVLPDAIQKVAGMELPTRARGAAKIEAAGQVANPSPIDASGPYNAAKAVVDNFTKGGSAVPNVVKQFIDRYEANPNMTWQEARQFYPNATNLSTGEMGSLNANSLRLVRDFASTLDQSIRDAATREGVGEQYATGMKQYRQASQIVRGAKTALKYGAIGAGVYGLGAGLGGHIVQRMLKLNKR